MTFCQSLHPVLKVTYLCTMCLPEDALNFKAKRLLIWDTLYQKSKVARNAYLLPNDNLIICENGF